MKTADQGIKASGDCGAAMTFKPGSGRPPAEGRQMTATRSQI
jgi:hypothetical protein